MKRDFNKWLLTFRKSISNYSYYTDFSKVYTKANSIKVELNILNSLIGSNNIQDDFKNLVAKYPEILKCIPILLAVRAKDIFVLDMDKEFNYSFEKMNYSVEQYCVFMEKTGLFGLLKNHIINNLFDYVTGVETGLDSNGRKNRGGHLMENLIENYLTQMGLCRDKDYFKEMYIHEIIEKWGYDLSAISNQGRMEKRFDFVVKKGEDVYVIETNFYTRSGSKLNETARSYKTIALEVANLQHVHFVWFTDGGGWITARHNLEETFDVMDDIYNIADIKNGVMKKLFV